MAQIAKLDLSVLDLREDEELDTLFHQFVVLASTLFRVMDPSMGEPFNESLHRMIAIMQAFPHTEAVHLARNRSGKMPYEVAFQRHVKAFARRMALALVQKRAHINAFNWPDEDEDEDKDAEDELAAWMGTSGSSAASASPTRRRATSQRRDNALEEGKHAQPSTAAGSRQLLKARTDRSRQHSDSPSQATAAANQAESAPLQSQGAMRTAKSTRTTSASTSKEPDAVAGEEEMQQTQSPEEPDECVSCEAQLTLASSGSATPLEVVLAVLRVVHSSEEHESESHRSLARQALQKLVDVCKAQHRDVLNAAATLTSIPGTRL